MFHSFFEEAHSVDKYDINVTCVKKKTEVRAVYLRLAQLLRF